MFQPSYSYDDIGLVPQEKSTIDSRDECEITTDFLHFGKALPVVVAPMEAAVSPEIERKGRDQGYVVCAPRDRSPLEGYGAIPTVSVKGAAHEYDSLGLPETICLDTANGFHSNVEKAVRTVRDMNKDVVILTGNVGSLAGFRFLNELEVDAVRVGIGNGSVCSTSIATGVGMGQATLVRQIAKWKQHAKPTYNTQIVADGGIWTAGHVSKAIALGADVVMAGRLFAATKEGPGDEIKFHDRIYKHYKGQASFAVKRSHSYVEGDDTLVPIIGTVEEVVARIKDGLRSAMAYMNARTLKEFRMLPDHYFTLLSGAAHRERGIYA